MIYAADKKQAGASGRKEGSPHRKGLSSDEDELADSDHTSGFDKRRAPFDVDNVDIDTSSLEQASGRRNSGANKAAPAPNSAESKKSVKSAQPKKGSPQHSEEDDFTKVQVLDPRQKPVGASGIKPAPVSAESKKHKLGTDEEERETPPDAIISSQKFKAAPHTNANSHSKGSSPYDIDGPSYLDPQTT